MNFITTNNFSVDLKVVVWSGKPWFSLRTEVNLKYPNIKEVSEKNSCKKHGEYLAELHTLPSGKSVWSGCPDCHGVLDKIHQKSTKEYLIGCGHNYNKITQKWSFDEKREFNNQEETQTTIKRNLYTRKT